MSVRTVQLGEVATIERHTATEVECANLPFVGLEHIESGSGNFAVEFKRRPEPMLATKFRFGTEHVLYGKLRPYLNKVALPDFDGVCTTEILPIVPKPGVIDRGFLYTLLLSPNFVRWASLRVSGANLPRLDPGMLEEFSFNLPSLSEQKRIAKLSEQADRLRRTRRYALELSDTFLPAAFLELFGREVDRFPMFTVEELAVGKPGSIRTGPFGSQLLHSEFTNSGIAVLGIDNAVNNRFEWAERRFITPQKYEQLKRYTVHQGDVLITIMGTCGRCAIVPDNIGTAINTKHLCCITLNQAHCLPVYLHSAFLHHPFVQHQLGVSQKGAIMEGLNMEIIKSLKIPLPPLVQQERFVFVVSRHERLRASERESLRQADHLFQSLLHSAFSRIA